MFQKHSPQELRIYLKPILDAVEADTGDDWVLLWGELQKLDRHLEREAVKKVPTKLGAGLLDPEDL